MTRIPSSRSAAIASDAKEVGTDVAVMVALRAMSIEVSNTLGMHFVFGVCCRALAVKACVDRNTRMDVRP